MFLKTGRHALASGVSCIVLAVAAAAYAQPAEPSPPRPRAPRARPAAIAPGTAARPATSGIEEVTVTGQKRSVKLAKAPATISVISGAALKQLEVRSFGQISRLLPGFSFEKSQGGNSVLSIRGVGTTSAAQSLEQSVSAYINGVYMGGNLREFATPLYDISQVEVLKGTQSGIAGQNTSVGAINIVTQAPGREYGGYLTAGHEFSFNGYNVEGAVDLPLSDKFTTRFSGLYDEVGGWIHNVRTGNYTGGNNTYSARSNSLWNVRDDVTVKLYVQYDKGNSLSNVVVPYGDPPSPVLASFNPSLEPNGSTSAVYGHRGRDGGDEFFDYDDLRGSLSVDWYLGGPTLTSITGGSRIHDELSVDADLSPLDLSWISQGSHYGQIHQEVRLVSPNNARLKYIVGAWYRHSTQDKQIDFYLDPGGPVHFVANIPFLQTTNTGSVFADLHYDLTDKLTIGGSGRYTYEEKVGQIAVNSNWPVTFLPYPQTSGKLTPGFVDGSATVQYAPTPTTNLYALFAHGTKTGAFVDLSDALVALKPEETNTFEVGTKLRFPSANLTTNLSAFRMNVTNYQDVYAILANGITQFASQNRDLHTEGLELQATWRPISPLTLSASTTLLDSHDATGGQAARAPHFSLSANARYDIDLPGDRKAAVFGNIYHTSSYLNNVVSANPDFTKTPAYTLVDLGVEAHPRPDLLVKFLCQNVTNEHAYLIVNVSPIDATAVQGALLPLRRFVLSGTYSF